MKTFLNLKYGAAPVQSLDLYLPDADSFPLFLYFHGGGLERGSRADTGCFAADLAPRGVAFATADYRMYPDAAFPDYIEDAAAAVAWILEHIGDYGRCTGVFVGGSSAGGYLSMMLCFNPRYLAAQGVRPEQIAGYLHDAGQPTAHFNMLRKSGVDPRRVIVDETAPLFYVGMEKEYPPMLILVSDNDMENRYEQTMLLASTLKHFGYAPEKIALEVMHGRHCRYLRETDADGMNVFSRRILRLVNGEL